MAGKETPTHRSRASLHAEYRAELNARVELLKQITHDQVVPVVREILRRFIERADEQLKYIEDGDQHLCASAGLEFQPSLLWKAIAQITVQYMPEARLPRPTTFATPQTILQGIVKL